MAQISRTAIAKLVSTPAKSDAARILGLQAHVLEARSLSEIDAAFETLSGLRAGALVVSTDPLSPTSVLKSSR
jgi:hypothetical protein